ncbi:MAG: acyl-CoA dehydrogenase [Nitrospirota bacterium]|nr:MAG: acyl-CoA dehydrogenase [Nitrospirota bacterium]
MSDNLTDERDQEFILFEQLDVEQFSKFERYTAFDSDLCRMVLNEARKLAIEELVPAYTEGDREGCQIEDGHVRVPERFHDLWRLVNEGEWPLLTVPQKDGGQGLPDLLGMAVFEYFASANIGFWMYMGLTHNAARLIADFSSEEQRERYLEKLLSGQWSGTMAITESDAGSDVGAIKTKATKNPDGTYSLKGSKLFISAGNQNMTENIIHVLLARVGGARSGTGGLSLFLVPNVRVNSDGSLGEPNDIKPVALENKLGLRGSATCQMNIGEDGNCIGEIVGEENQGIQIMFQMMNRTRLDVGCQAASHAGTAYQHSLAYAKERLQGKELTAPVGSGQVPIIRHPDVRRMLLYMKAITEGLRALNMWGAYCADKKNVAASDVEKREWEGQLALLTPICKAYCSDMGFRVCETAIQVHGGYGYTQDFVLEQILRDQKSTSIFEGTNGIQALDLVERKIKQADGKHLRIHLQRIVHFCEENEDHPSLRAEIKLLDEAESALKDASSFLIEASVDNPYISPLFSVPYLKLLGDVTVGWLLLWQAVVAHEKLATLAKDEGLGLDETSIDELVEKKRDAAFYSGKLASARFFAGEVLIMSPTKARAILRADQTPLKIADQSF